MKAQQLHIVPGAVAGEKGPILQVSGFDLWHRDTHILKDVNAVLRRDSINCIIGPSGSGKSTFIRSLNRINDEVAGFVRRGDIHFEGLNIYEKSVDVTRLRTEIGMVFQKPSVFPKSIFENVLFGIQHQKKMAQHEKMQIVEETLRSVALWREVSHRLSDPAASLSIGQQQRLCLARTLAVKPKVILLDEPTSSLDPVSARAIEDLMLELKKKYTLVFVTHNIQQAKRIADHVIFLCGGRIIEQASKLRLFANPQEKETKSYLNEEFCDC